MKSTDVKHKFIELRAKGFSFTKISNKMKISRQTLIDWNKEYENEIANLKAVELEELFHKYFLHREARIKSFGAILIRLKFELKNRDLSTVSTEKLLELALKFDSQLKDEVIELNYKSSTAMKSEKETNELLDNLTTHPL